MFISAKTNCNMATNRFNLTCIKVVWAMGMWIFDFETIELKLATATLNFYTATLNLATAKLNLALQNFIMTIIQRLNLS